MLLLVGHLRRTGIGRAIVGVRENESGAAAFTVSPTRAKLTAFALGGFLAGLGGAVLAGTVQTFGYHDAFFRVQDSLSIVAIAVIGGLGSLAGAVMGAVWVVGLPLFWPKNQTVAAAHVEHRAAHRAALHPGRIHAARLRAPRHDPALAREAASRSGRPRSVTAPPVSLSAPRGRCAADERRRQRRRAPSR